MESPILFLVFNRPDTTRRVFEAIRNAQPSKLYIAADGPRLTVLGELEKTAEVRDLVSKIDWPCELRTRFNDENMGCKRAVSSAITWFFEHEEEGIILEDDILPDPSFFPYCDQLLTEYRDDPDVASISGCNFVADKIPTDDSYVFSRYCHIWGWATWRRSWALYDVEMTDWPDWHGDGGLAKISDGTPNFENYWSEIFQKVYQGVINAWGYQWIFRCWKHNNVSILPSRNLVENIGFGGDATNTTGKKPEYLENLEVNQMDFPLSHPDITNANTIVDNVISKTVYSATRRSIWAARIQAVPIVGKWIMNLKRRLL